MRGMLRLKRFNEEFYWISLDGLLLLRGHRIDEAEELQLKFHRRHGTCRTVKERQRVETTTGLLCMTIYTGAEMNSLSLTDEQLEQLRACIETAREYYEMREINGATNGLCHQEAEYRHRKQAAIKLLDIIGADFEHSGSNSLVN